MSNIIGLLLLLVLSQGALAKSFKPMGAGECSLLLSPQAPALDYALSDLEGSYLELVKKVQSAPDIPPARIEYFIKDVLNMKASVLNDVMELLPMVLVATSEGPKRARVVASLYNMLESLGIPPSMYGLEVDANSRVILPAIPEKIRAAANRKPAEVRNAPIGFIKPSSVNDGGKAPEGTHRSIGFGAHSIEAYPMPDRQTGFIQRGIMRDNEMVMVVLDREKKAQYQVDISVLTSAGAQSESHKYELHFNSEQREWIVLVENLNNPSGHIGFR